jgi:hypothetical protein
MSMMALLRGFHMGCVLQVRLRPGHLRFVVHTMFPVGGKGLCWQLLGDVIVGDDTPCSPVAGDRDPRWRFCTWGTRQIRGGILAVQ